MIERRVLWTLTAQCDLDAIVAYIATDSIENAM
jgi:plasmid stabilization system protein ParE